VKKTGETINNDKPSASTLAAEKKAMLEASIEAQKKVGSTILWIVCLFLYVFSRGLHYTSSQLRYFYIFI